MPSSSSAERTPPIQEVSAAQAAVARKRSKSEAAAPAEARSERAAAVIEVGADNATARVTAGKTTARNAKARVVQRVDAGFLESLMGYSVRRASLAMVSVFMKGMAEYDLKIVEFSVLSLVASNPGITSRQLCKQLDLLPPNMAVMMDSLVQRGYVQRRPHPSDGRATGLYLSAEGELLMATAQPQLKASEEKAVAHLSEAEQKMLIELLRKLY